MNIESIISLENQYEKFLDIYNKNPLPIALCGAGAGADWAIKLLKKNNITPTLLIDRNPNIQNKWNLQLLSYEELISNYSNNDLYIIISSPKYRHDIYNSIKNFFNSEQIFDFECELYYNYIHNINEYRQYLLDNKIALYKLYDQLSDTLSKNTLENVFKGRFSADLSYFQNIYQENQYFAKDIVSLTNNETYCDIGAYIGDTVEEIVKLTNGNYNKIFCFEPDKLCFEKLKNNTSSFKNITLINKGAWNKRETLFLSTDSSHGASKIDSKGHYSIELDQLDNCIPPETKITHIKMDIEGAELNALKGAKNIIQRDTPILAICVYHKIQDFVEIPNYILSLVPDYKLYLRHHNISGTETVLYAIKPQS